MRSLRHRVGWLVVFALVALPVAAQYDPFIGGKNKVRYDTFKWQTYETPHFKISFYDRVEPRLQRVASYAESSYDELARKLNFQILDPIPMIIYATHAEFEQTNVMLNFIPEGVGAFATPARNRMVLPVDLPDRELQALIQHELTHIFQYEILFQGRTARAIYRRPPQWFMEGMASYFGDDEDSRDEAYMRDLALADRVPSVMSPPGGFLAYRFGHKVFSFIEAEWGEDGVRDFIFAVRNAFGGRMSGPFYRAFNMDIEEFDSRFRSWLRDQYDDYRDRGGPGEFGRRVRVSHRTNTQEVSPVASPSGDLVAAFSTYKNDVDVVVAGVPDRRLYKNLTKGTTNRYDYLVAQALTVGADHGRDLAFSPDGNLVAVFGRTERYRNLFLLDANKGGIKREIEIPLPIDQAMEPAFSQDGRTVAFRGYANGQSDIFLLDLETEEIRNLTNDHEADSAPAFAPDGVSLVYSTQLDEYMKLVRVSLADPSEREQLSFGPGNDEAPVLSLNGEHVYFASDREDGIYDIYRAHLENRTLERLTHVWGLAINPTPVMTLEGERVVFQSFHRGNWDLYVVDPKTGVEVGTAEPLRAPEEPQEFLPAVSIPVDLDQAKKVKRRKLFIEDARAYAGIDPNSVVTSQIYISMSDQYGDRRLSFLLSSIDTFSNFRVSYANLDGRWQWGATLFDYRSFYVFGYDPIRNQFNDREQIYRQTGAAFNLWYPLSSSLRFQSSLGFVDRQADFPYLDPESGDVAFQTWKDQVPYVTAGLAGDTSNWQSYGPHSGSRWEVDLLYAQDLDQGGPLSYQGVAEGRKYLPTSLRSELAVRLYLAAANGNRPTIFAVGGLDTVRGLNYRSMTGNRVGLFNVEWRFPLIDYLEMPFMRIGNVRGRVFADVGTAWYDVNGVKYNYLGEPGYTFIENGRLQDGAASYGFGLSVWLLGVPMHWDFYQRWDFKESLGSMDTYFWIGWRF